ncbi:MAG: YceD family protein [Solirubrobacterales bacterium]
MLLQLDLSWLKLHPKETQKFHLSESADKLGLSFEGFRFVDDVDCDLTVTNTGKLLVSEGTLAVTVEAGCARCLKPVREAFSIPFSVEFCAEENRPDFEGEESFVYFTEPQINMADIISETVLVNLPLRFLCQDDCRGLCAACGADLNIGECGCVKDEIDPRWEALKQMMKGKEG